MTPKEIKAKQKEAKLPLNRMMRDHNRMHMRNESFSGVASSMAGSRRGLSHQGSGDDVSMSQ